jgi:hypothetical protein
VARRRGSPGPPAHSAPAHSAPTHSAPARAACLRAGFAADCASASAAELAQLVPVADLKGLLAAAVPGLGPQYGASKQLLLQALEEDAQIRQAAGPAIRRQVRPPALAGGCAGAQLWPSGAPAVGRLHGPAPGWPAAGAEAAAQRTCAARLAGGGPARCVPSGGSPHLRCPSFVPQLGRCVRLAGGLGALLQRLQRLYFLEEGADLGRVLAADRGALRFPRYQVGGGKGRGRGGRATGTAAQVSNAMGSCTPSYNQPANVPRSAHWLGGAAGVGAAGPLLLLHGAVMPPRLPAAEVWAAALLRRCHAACTPLGAARPCWRTRARWATRAACTRRWRCVGISLGRGGVVLPGLLLGLLLGPLLGPLLGLPCL